MITWWMKLGENLPLGHNALLFSISGTESIICPVAETRLDIPRPLINQIRTADLSVHSWTRKPPDHDDRPGK